MGRMREIIQMDLKTFLKVGLWKADISHQAFFSRLLFLILRVSVIVLEEFKKDNVRYKATNLTYYSVLSLVPVLAIILAISKGLGIELGIRTELARYFGGNEYVLEKLIEWSSEMLKIANGGVIIGISAWMILFVVLRLMHNVEQAFNEIWSVPGRKWDRKISDYMTIILLTPVLLTFSGTTSMFLASQFRIFLTATEMLVWVKELILTGVALTSYFLVCFYLTLLYLIFPNTRVRVIPAVVGGFFAGTMFQIIQSLWINGQILIGSYNTVYGTFAAIPLFMIYIQVSWYTVLIGAEVSYAAHYLNDWKFGERVMLDLSSRQKKHIMALIMYHHIQNFRDGKPPISCKRMASKMSIPRSYVREYSALLCDCGLLNLLSSREGKVEEYQPSRDINGIDMQMVWDRIEKKGKDEIEITASPEYAAIKKFSLEASRIVSASPGNLLLKDLIGEQRPQEANTSDSGSDVRS